MQRWLRSNWLLLVKRWGCDGMKRSTDPGGSADEPIGDAERREGTRFPLLLNARCIRRDGREMQVWLTDISRTGCQIFACAELLKRQDTVVVLSCGDESRSGEIAWAEGPKAGVRFDLALPPFTIKHLLSARPKPVRQTEYSDDRPVDQFGRKLAPLPPIARCRRIGAP
jgi:hypothetical protein